MSEKKYASLNTLQTFLDNLKTLFATKTSVEELSDVIKQYVDLSFKSSRELAESDDKETLKESKDYTDTAVAQKSQVQIITWGADD